MVGEVGSYRNRSRSQSVGHLQRKRLSLKVVRLAGVEPATLGLEDEGR